MSELTTIIEPVDTMDKFGKWIPCSERLPEIGRFLVTVTNRSGKALYIETSWFQNGRWFHDGEVIAWMPLPKPYGEREGE